MQVTIEADEYKRAAKVLRAEAPELMRAWRKEIRTAANPVLQDMRGEVLTLSLPASTTTGTAVGLRGGGGGGILAAAAAATRVSVVGSGAFIKCYPGRLGAAAQLPAYWDDGQRWGHRVFGRKGTGVTQRASRDGWFTKTARLWHPRIKEDMQDVVKRYTVTVAAKL